MGQLRAKRGQRLEKIKKSSGCPKVIQQIDQAAEISDTNHVAQNKSEIIVDILIDVCFHDFFSSKFFVC